MRGVRLATVAAVLAVPATAGAQRTTLAEAARNVAVVCKKFVERDNMDVRTLEDGLEKEGADFREITDIRLLCEVYALGRRDQRQADEAELAKRAPK